MCGGSPSGTMDNIDVVLTDGAYQSLRSDFGKLEFILSLPPIPFVANEEGVQLNDENKRCMAQISPRGNLLLQDEDFEVPAIISIKDYVQWLQEKGASFMTTGNKNRTYKLLVKLAGDLKILPLGINFPSLIEHSANVDTSSWMHKLIQEMSTVEENVFSEVRDSGILVWTNWPYATLLRDLAEAVMEQGSQPNPLFQEEMEASSVNISSNEYVEWLERESSFIWGIMNQPASRRDTGNQAVQRVFRTVMKLADDLEYLRPGDESHLEYEIKMASWWIYWNELIAEMKRVEKHFPPEIRYSGVYVYTTWPYKEFLRTLAGELCE